MTNEQKIFNEAMSEIGGIYIPLGRFELDPVLNAMLDVVKQHLEVTNALNKHLPKVNVFYANNMNINACAFKAENQYFISINVGTVIRLKEIFDKIVNNKKIADEVFEKNNVLYNSATLLYFAMIFLIAHEHSHIRFGHCDLINHLWSNSEVNFLNEATSNCLVKDGIFRQTLEYDADCCAIANVINRQIMSKDYHNRKFEDFSKAIGLCSLSCYILFKIFDNGEHSNYENYKLDELSKSTHPRPGIRIDYIMGNIATLLLKYYDNKEVNKIIDKVFENIKTFEMLFNNEIDIKKLEIGIAYTKKGREHMETIHNNWKEVSKLLEPFTNDGLAEFESYKSSNRVFID